MLSQSPSEIWAEVTTLIALWIGAFSFLYALYISYPKPEMALEPAERILALEAERDMLAARLGKREKSLANERAQTTRLSFRVEKGTKDLAKKTEEASTFVTAYQSISKQLEDCAVTIRDKDRVIQTQSREVERLEHRVAHAQECLEAKDNLLKRKDLDVRGYQKLANSDVNAITRLSQEIATKDEQLWKAAGRYTFADQELTKLKLCVSEGAKEAIERRDNTIKQLEQKVQNLNEVVEHEPPGFEKGVDRLLRSRLMDARSDLLLYQRQLYERNNCMRLQGKKIDEINARNLAFQHELKESVSTCASLQKALDASELKKSELHTELQTRTQELTKAIQKQRSHDETCDDRTAKFIALKKAADSHEKANHHLTAKFTKVTTKLQAEKQHILDALTSTQHSLQAANATIHSQDTTITRNRTELTKANDRFKEAGTSVGQQTDGEARASEQLQETQSELIKVTAELELKRSLIDSITAHAKREIDAKQAALEETEAQRNAVNEHLVRQRTEHPSQLQAIRDDYNEMMKHAYQDQHRQQLEEYHQAAENHAQELHAAYDREKVTRSHLDHFTCLSRAQKEKIDKVTAELKTAREESQATLQEKQKLVDELKAKLHEPNDRAERFATLERNYAIMQITLRSTQKNLSKSQAENTESLQRAKEANALAKERLDQRIQMVDKYIALQEQRNKFQKLSSEREKELAAANAQLAEHKESYDALTQKLADRDERVAQLEAHATVQQKKIVLLVEKWEHLHKVYAELKRTCLERQEQLATANAELTKHKESHDALTQHLAERDERISQLSATSQQQHASLTKANAGWLETIAYYKDAKQQVLLKRDQLKELAAENQKIKAEREELMSHMATVSEALMESDAKNENLEGLASRLQAKLEEWRDEAANLQEEVEEYREVERREGFVSVEEEDGEEGEEVDCEYVDEEESESESEEEFGEFEVEEEEVEILSCPDEDEAEAEAEGEEFFAVEEADCSYDGDDLEVVEEEVEEDARSSCLEEANDDDFEEVDEDEAEWEVENGEPEQW